MNYDFFIGKCKKTLCETFTPKILILIGGHLCTAPRPQKEAETLAQEGYKVIVRGIWFDPELIKRDQSLIKFRKWRFEPIIDLHSNNYLTNFSVRVKGRIARACYKRLGVFSSSLLGYGVEQMLKVAYETKADLTIVHCEGGLWVGARLLEKGFRVGVDFEDWFSEDLLSEARVTRPIEKIKTFEKYLVQNCQYCLTTSHALADAISKSYQAPKPMVVYNTFPWSERKCLDNQKKNRKNLSIPSLHWFSQTIGTGRGLEVFFQSLSHIKIPIEVHLRGSHSKETIQWAKSQISPKWHDRIFFHATVPHSELLSRIAEHDVGLALEIPCCLSRQFTITNKLFQYMQAGLAVIATDTAGQREIFQQCPDDIGRLISHGDPLAMAKAIEDLVGKPENLEKAKVASLKICEEKFCWEKCEGEMLKIGRKAMQI